MRKKMCVIYFMPLQLHMHTHTTWFLLHYCSPPPPHTTIAIDDNCVNCVTIESFFFSFSKVDNFKIGKIERDREKIEMK